MALTAAGIDNVRFEARLLLAKASGLSVEELISHGRDEVPAGTVEVLRALTARRVQRDQQLGSGSKPRRRQRGQQPVNDRGQVVGRSQTITGEFHAFFWSATTGMIDLGAFGYKP